MLSDRALIKIRHMRSKYQDARSCLLPSLHVVQEETGWISPAAMEAVGELLNVPNNFEGAGVYKVLAFKINETIKAPELDGIEVSTRKTERITAEVSA